MAKCTFALLCIFWIVALSLSAQDTNRVEQFKEAYSLAEEDSTRWAAALNVADAYTFIQTDSVLQWSRIALDLALEMDEAAALGKSHFQMGLAHWYKQDFQAAMQEYLKAVDFYEQTGDIKGLNEAKVDIAMVHLRMNELDKVKPKLDEAYAYFLQEVDSSNIIYTLGAYQMYYENKSMFDSLLHYAHENLDAILRFKRTKNLGRIYSNLAATYLYLDQLEEAKEFMDKRTSLGFEGDERGVYYHYYVLSEYFYKSGQTDSAVHYAKLGMEQAKFFGDPFKEAEMFAQLSEIYVADQDYENAFQYLKLENEMMDSVDRIRFQEELSELSIQYETKEKEAELARQQLQLQKETNRKNLFFIAGLGFLALAGGVFFYYRARLKSRQQQAEMELQLKEVEAEQLRKMDQAKSTFFANISHEFRTPLTLILNPLKQMKEGSLKGDAQKTLDRMIRNGDRLLRLVNQLLDFARLDAGFTQLNEEDLDLNPYIKALVFSFESWPLRKGIFFQTDFPSEAVFVRADADKLEKILSNLLSNAFKFTPEKGRVNFSMRVLGQENGKTKLEFLVKDTGTGIPEDQLPHIFDRFYSRSLVEESTYSSGIGLALTKELVQWLGGTIQVESQEGKGTSFKVELPFKTIGTIDYREPSFVQENHLEEANGLMAGTSLSKYKPSVLLVEDNPDLRQYIKEQLQPRYQVVEAQNGKRGLELAFDALPDLVISDIMMPEIDGLSLCQQLKSDERSSHIPVVLLTALAEQNEKLSGLEQGADAYLTKPFDPKELQVVSRNLIDQRREMREKFAQGFGAFAESRDWMSERDAAFLEKLEKTVLDQMENTAFGIEELGKHMNMSRSQLYRKVKALTDQSPSAFIRSIRLREGYKLLEQRQGNITEVAIQVGIPNLPYFSRSFHEQFGFPPSELLHDQT